MKHIPLTIVFAALILIFAQWPSVQTWSDMTSLHHYLVHTLYLLSGGIIGWQTSRWNVRTAQQAREDAGVMS